MLKYIYQVICEVFVARNTLYHNINHVNVGNGIEVYDDCNC